MSFDYIVRFKRGAKDLPTHEQVQMVLEDYLTGIGAVRWDAHCFRWVVDLPGNALWAMRRVFPDSPRAKADVEDPMARGFEVYWGMGGQGGSSLRERDDAPRR